MADFKRIDNARRIFGLSECATLKEIKEAYRRMAFQYHPDRWAEKDKKLCEQMFKKITDARDTLLRYCAGYCYSFKEEDVRRNTMEGDFYSDHIRRFYDGWMINL